EGSSQRKLNRDGAYFAFDLAWAGATARDPGGAKDAPRVVENAAVLAPPSEDRRTSSELKNRKAPPEGAAGGRGREGRGKPSLRSIRPDDLRRISAVVSLYDQAT